MRMSEFAAMIGLTVESVLLSGKVGGKEGFKFKTTLKYKNMASDMVAEIQFHQGAAHVEKLNDLAKWVPCPMQEVDKRVKQARWGERSIMGLRPALPTLETVLDCLRSDCVSIDNSPLWEDWASDLGYNVDSIKDKKVYEACVEEYQNLRTFFKNHFRLFLTCEEG